MKLFNFKPLREYGWSFEGYNYRKGNASISLPLKSKKINPIWKVRIVGGRTGTPLETGECNVNSREEAFKAGNKLVKQLKKAARKAKK